MKNLVYLSIVLIFTISVSVFGVGMLVGAYNDTINVSDGGYVYESSNEKGPSGMPLGGSTSDDFSIGGDLTVSGNMESLRGVTTQSSTTNETLTASQICDNDYLAYTPIQSMTLTLPATSTISSCLDTAGVSMSYVIENAATTTNNITLAAGTGMDLQEPDGQNVVIGQNNFAWLTFVKQSSGDIVVRVDETIPAD